MATRRRPPPDPDVMPVHPGRGAGPAELYRYQARRREWADRQPPPPPFIGPRLPDPRSMVHRVYADGRWVRPQDVDPASLPEPNPPEPQYVPEPVAPEVKSPEELAALEKIARGNRLYTRRAPDRPAKPQRGKGWAQWG